MNYKGIVKLLKTFFGIYFSFIMYTNLTYSSRLDELIATYMKSGKDYETAIKLANCQMELESEAKKKYRHDIGIPEIIDFTKLIK